MQDDDDDVNFDDDYQENEDDDDEFWEPLVMYQGPLCHYEVWEGPEALEYCPICGRTKNQPPPHVNANDEFQE